MHISCSYNMVYVINFDIWEVRIMSFRVLGSGTGIFIVWSDAQTDARLALPGHHM